MIGPKPEAREVGRAWTRRGAERLYAQWDMLPGGGIWKPIIVAIDELDDFHEWLNAEPQEEPA